MPTEETASGALFQFSPDGESDWSDTQRDTDNYMRFVFNITSYSNAIKMPGTEPEWPLLWPANMFPQDISSSKWSNITALPELDNSSYNYPVYNVDYTSAEGLGLFLLEIPENTEALTITVTAQPANAAATGNNMEWMADFCIYRDATTEGTVTAIKLGSTVFNTAGQTTGTYNLSLSELTDGTLTAQEGDRIAFAIYPSTTNTVSPKQTDWQVSCIKFEAHDEVVIDVDNDLIAHWVYSENVSTGGTWADTSGNNRDLTLQYDAYVDENGLNLDGTDDYASSSATMGISGAAERTVSFWINPANLTTGNYYGINLFSIGSWSAGNLFQAGIIGSNNTEGHSPSTIILEFFTSYIVGSTQVETNNWSFISGTYDGTTANLYVNGNLENFSELTINTTDTSINVGTAKNISSTIWSWLSYNGSMDDFRLYSRCLTADEISYLYEQGR